MKKLFIILLISGSIMPVYSQDVIEPTPQTLVDGGYVWLSPGEKTVRINEEFTWDVHVSTAGELLAAYRIEVSWPPEIMTAFQNIYAPPDGYIIQVLIDLPEPGIIRLTGFDASGAGPSDDLHLCSISFTAGDQPVTNATVEVAVDILVNPDTYTIGPAEGIDATITIDLFYGDVNEDGVIDIIDALLVAQYYVGLNPAGFTAPVEAGEANLDGRVDIVDALMIAQYYVGICDCPNFPPHD